MPGALRAPLFPLLCRHIRRLPTHGTRLCGVAQGVATYWYNYIYHLETSQV